MIFMAIVHGFSILLLVSFQYSLSPHPHLQPISSAIPYMFHRFLQCFISPFPYFPPPTILPPLCHMLVSLHPQEIRILFDGRPQLLQYLRVYDVSSGGRFLRKGDGSEPFDPGINQGRSDCLGYIYYDDRDTRRSQSATDSGSIKAYEEDMISYTFLPELHRNAGVRFSFLGEAVTECPTDVDVSDPVQPHMLGQLRNSSGDTYSLHEADIKEGQLRNSSGDIYSLHEADIKEAITSFNLDVSCICGRVFLYESWLNCGLTRISRYYAPIQYNGYRTAPQEPCIPIGGFISDWPCRLSWGHVRGHPIRIRCFADSSWAYTSSWRIDNRVTWWLLSLHSSFWVEYFCISLMDSITFCCLIIHELSICLFKFTSYVVVTSLTLLECIIVDLEESYLLTVQINLAVVLLQQCTIFVFKAIT